MCIVFVVVSMFSTPMAPSSQRFHSYCLFELHICPHPCPPVSLHIIVYWYLTIYCPFLCPHPQTRRRPYRCLSGGGWSQLSAEKVSRLPDQDMPHEPVLGPEAVLEHGQAEQRQHGRQFVETVTCKCAHVYNYSTIAGLDKVLNMRMVCSCPVITHTVPAPQRKVISRGDWRCCWSKPMRLWYRCQFL